MDAKKKNIRLTQEECAALLELVETELAVLGEHRGAALREVHAESADNARRYMKIGKLTEMIECFQGVRKALTEEEER